MLKISTDTSQHFYGHGKLLLTGEYFVLDGAKALAIPTKFGQHVRVKELSANSNTLYWVSLNSKKEIWLNLVFDKTTLECVNSELKEAKTLSLILQTAKKLNPDFLNEEKDFAVETYLEFPNEWGLGSSSTLIYCIAEWADVNGLELLQKTVGGSGYDVACAGNDSPILYERKEILQPTITPVLFQPPFSEQLYFVYTGQKQLSTAGIKHYQETVQEKANYLTWINTITEAMLQCASIAKFEQLIEEHETLISEALQSKKVKDTMFPDYWGGVKSLGAWGGDFVLMTNSRSDEELKAYLHAHNLKVVFKFDELIYK